MIPAVRLRVSVGLNAACEYVVKVFLVGVTAFGDCAERHDLAPLQNGALGWGEQRMAFVLGPNADIAVPEPQLTSHHLIADSMSWGCTLSWQPFLFETGSWKYGRNHKRETLSLEERDPCLGESVGRVLMCSGGHKDRVG